MLGYVRLVLRLRPLAFATFLVWRLRIGACGVGACGFWRLRQLPPQKKLNMFKVILGFDHWSCIISRNWRKRAVTFPVIPLEYHLFCLSWYQMFPVCMFPATVEISRNSAPNHNPRVTSSLHGTTAHFLCRMLLLRSSFNLSAYNHGLMLHLDLSRMTSTESVRPKALNGHEDWRDLNSHQHSPNPWMVSFTGFGESLERLACIFKRRQEDSRHEDVFKGRQEDVTCLQEQRACCRLRKTLTLLGIDVRSRFFVGMWSAKNKSEWWNRHRGFWE